MIWLKRILAKMTGGRLVWFCWCCERPKLHIARYVEGCARHRGWKVWIFLEGDVWLRRDGALFDLGSTTWKPYDPSEWSEGDL
jgi:hypothetical protein